MKTRGLISLPHFLLEFGIVTGLFVITPLVSGWLNLRGTPWFVGFIGAMNLAFMGTILLLQAKWPLYRQGKFFTLGAPEGQERAYWIGLWLSGIGCGAATLLVLQSFIWR